MDLGLGTLATLKRHVLKPALAAETTWDAMLQDLGKGVAASLERYCNRKFARVVGATAEFSADRINLILPRYPVETITSLELRGSASEDYEVQTQADIIAERDDQAGLIGFLAPLGEYYGSIRVTWTGGYWYDTAETEDTSQPVGTTLLPADLRWAWVLQCQTIWEKVDKIGGGISGKPGAWSNLADLKLSAEVERMVANYRRMQMT